MGIEEEEHDEDEEGGGGEGGGSEEAHPHTRVLNLKLSKSTPNLSYSTIKPALLVQQPSGSIPFSVFTQPTRTDEPPAQPSGHAPFAPFGEMYFVNTEMMPITAEKPRIDRAQKRNNKRKHTNK